MAASKRSCMSGAGLSRARSLATITGLIGIQVVLSALGGQEQLQCLRAIKAPLALLLAPAVFIYVSQVRQDAEALAGGGKAHRDCRE